MSATKLEEYNRKRNFEKTWEPEGKPVPAGKRLKFVVQHHLARKDHYDFRLEWDGALLSWAVPKGPSRNVRDKRLAIRVEDHPLEYRNFEGTIPKGQYGGGTVMLWDEGFWEPLSEVAEGLRAGSLKFVLKGKRLQGKWALVRLKAKAGKEEDNWLLIKEKDGYAKDTDGISGFVTSVRTGRSMEEIEAGKEEKITRNPFQSADAQLAKLVAAVPEGEDWLYEIKYDGYRILAYAEGGAVRLVTRNGNDYTERFQEVADSIAAWSGGRAMVLDGEMTVADSRGRTDFQALQSYLKNPGDKQLTYLVFDVLALDGEDLRELPLTDRKNTLEALLNDAPKNLRYSRHVEGNGKESLLAACKLNLEGIVGKKPGSVYSGTRNGDWIKLKCEKRQEFVIGGYTRSEKRLGGISSLLLGVYEGKDLVYAGRAGTGLSEKSMRELEEKFEPIKRESPPFRQAPKTKKNETVTWLQPETVAEIRFAEWTEEHLLRQASFKGLRSDKNPEEVRMEEPNSEKDKSAEGPKTPAPSGAAKSSSDGGAAVMGVRISNPEKVLFEDSGITKADVARYYAAVSERMLPYAANRILSIVRCPKGISAACFFKKHPGPGSKGVVTIPVQTGSGETEDYFYLENAAGLISEAQMGTLEFHIWGSRVENIEKPDLMVFDLDPDEGMELAGVRRGVRDIKSVLDQLSLTSFLKTSGGKGYHVVVPFQPSVGWDAFHDFAKRTAELMEQKWPDRYTSNIRKEKRKGRIFIDWIRNGRGATSIAPYSIRARAGASVSMPITWKELDTVAPSGIHMADALKRIQEKDPWDGFFRLNQRLK
ncbi:DNA ligase D [Caproicibacter fermentans]|uniref:DNA ligase (ATP) n=1 Tax=Caproicibacter fermentans TaxID=2576756 RepID=A0A7G8T810_9FIRM|nr:DNA ligase D [Caproicibacter fermentans]QNK39751.1 DNA ligase D [Caproicibacter fermentans]